MEDISILPAKPLSQRLPPRQGKELERSALALSHLGFRNEETEALQLVLAAEDFLVGAPVYAGPHQTGWPSSGHHALHGGWEEVLRRLDPEWLKVKQLCSGSGLMSSHVWPQSLSS